MDENDYRNFQSKKPAPESTGRKTRDDYAREREERAAEVALSLFSRKKSDGGGYAPARKQEGLIRHSTKTSIPDVAGRGPKVELPKPPGGPAATATPFSISLVKDGSAWKAKVRSGILRRLDNTELVEVAGTYDSEDEDTEYPVVDNDSVWIEVTIASGVPTLAEIKVGAEWPGHPKLAKYADTEPYSPEKSIILLGKIIEDAASEATPKPLIVTDAVPGNRMLVQGVVNGKLAWVGINA